MPWFQNPILFCFVVLHAKGSKSCWRWCKMKECLTLGVYSCVLRRTVLRQAFPLVDKVG